MNILNILILLVLLYSCENRLITKNLIGQWVSENNIDTLNFINDNKLERSVLLKSFRSEDQPFNQLNFYELKHSYDYSISSDEITLQYQGPFNISVMPSTHPCEIRGDILTIDFTKGCYGFESRISVYHKID